MASDSEGTALETDMTLMQTRLVRHEIVWLEYELAAHADGSFGYAKRWTDCLLGIARLARFEQEVR